MSEVTYREAVIRALGDALVADDSVFLLGEDIGAAGGVFKTTDGLQKRFGAGRVRDTPISEQAIVGLAIGAALQGLRPVAEIMFADFAGVAFDQIANQLAKYRYMSGGQVAVPATVRLMGGIGGGFGAQHSQTPENWFLSIAGLKIVTPATPADAYGLLSAAILDDDPVLVFEHKGLLNSKGELADRPEPIAIGSAAVVRPGTAVTIVANQMMRLRALEAAEQLAGEGIEAEVIDPRTIVPFDFETVAESVDRTNNLVVVQEAPPAGSWGATLIARLVEECFDSFDSPPTLLAGDETPIGYAESLETAWAPDVERIGDAVRATLGVAAPSAG
ncbi:MAG: alpha-ketoacid dehydrogenase subunit beta [Actinobacteria bacterium]|nr:alpha-ketoacid dehydrogenase subunit beta [Actinomycetota bacterium]